MRDVYIVIIRSKVHAIFTWEERRICLIKMIFLTVLIPIEYEDKDSKNVLAVLNTLDGGLVIQKVILNKTIGDEGITVDFWIIKVHTSN